MKIRRKMVSIVLGGVILSAIGGTALIYTVVQDKILTASAVSLREVTQKFANFAFQRFSESSVKLRGFEHILEMELQKPIQKDEIKAFYQQIELDSDGVWRNKKSNFNGNFESGVFLPSNPKEETDLQKIQHLRIKNAMDFFGAASSRRMENIWYLSPQRSEIIFDKTYPNFAFNQKSDNDYTQTPWMIAVSPESDPKQETRFTPPLFDPVPKVWMVSAVHPLYVNGKWMGSIGEDMALTNVLEFAFTSEQLYKDSEHFLIDNEGNFVLAGSQQKELETSETKFKPDFNKEPELAHLFDSTLANIPRVVTNNLTLHNRRYLAIGMTLEPLGWRYYLLTPVDEILATTRALFISIAEMILAIGALNGLLIFFAAGRTITNRIQVLTDAINNYDDKNYHAVANRLKGKDEIFRAAVAFDNMVSAIHNEANQKEQMQQQLFQSQKLEAIGQLTSGIAHDFNNILMAIIGFTNMGISFLQRQEHEQCINAFSKVEKASRRAENLVDKMLTFCRENTIKAEKPVNPSMVISEVIGISQMLRSGISKSIEIDFSNTLDEKIVGVLVDPSELHQLVTNLIINAKDAIGDQKGIIHIRLAHKHPVNGFRHRCSACGHVLDADYISLSVSDTGCGISAEKISRIFDPFFTTKEVGKGTGLGLSVVSGIVHNANGHIIVESELNKGTTFSLLFPTIYQHDMELENEADVNAISSFNRNKIRIAVVDDELILCDLLNMELTSLGFQVNVFSNPLLAWQEFSTNPEHFDVVITDCGMPSMTGIELIDAVLSVTPKKLILMCTGYSDKVKSRNDLPDGNIFLFKKPVDTMTLDKTIVEFFENKIPT